jgi:hypothetical protein
LNTLVDHEPFYFVPDEQQIAVVQLVQLIVQAQIEEEEWERRVFAYQ